MTQESATAVSQPATLGIDHLGLTVRNLDVTVNFFVECLGWRLLGRKPDYPAAFVTDDQAVLTLWQVLADPCVPFDRRMNVGLHHLALRVGTLEKLEALHVRVKSWPNTRIEFAPETSGAGPKTHFIASEPGGLRIEFAFDPRRPDS